MCRLFAFLCLGLVGVQSTFSADGLTAAQVSAARKVYVAKCAKCHRFYEPTNYSETEWRSWMEKMNRKAKLKAEQATLLNLYLDVYRAGKLGAKPEGKPTEARSRREDQRAESESPPKQPSGGSE